MSLQFSDGSPFSSGSCSYERRPATEQETSPRILIQVAIAGVPTYAMVDTGGVYLICHPEFASLLDLRDIDLVEEGVPLTIPRYGRVRGKLYRVSLMLPATDGNSLELGVTAFVPRPLTHSALPFPPVMGLLGCLENLRFAVDPCNDTFYFGTLANEG
jgi:hypothetical protein